MKVELQTKSGQNCVSKMVRTRTAGSPIYERTIYIDGVFEYHMLENGTTYEKNYVHVMDNTSRIATIKTGNDFGDTTPAIKYNLEDHLGSSSILLKDNGTLINKEEYYPFGDTSFGSYAKKRYRYSGKEKDQESGLYYYGARYYMAMGCRFVSVDPLASDYPYLMPFNYAGNKPITHEDIDGLQGTGDNPVKKEVIDRTSETTSLENIERDVEFLKEQNVKDGDQYIFIYGGKTKDRYTYTYQQSQNKWHGQREAKQLSSSEKYFPDSPLYYIGSNLNSKSAEDSKKEETNFEIIFDASTINLTDQDITNSILDEATSVLLANPESSITLYGNANVTSGQDWEDMITGMLGMTWNNLSEQRNEVIKEMLIESGVDESQINLERGSQDKIGVTMTLKQ